MYVRGCMLSICLHGSCGTIDSEVTGTSFGIRHSHSVVCSHYNKDLPLFLLTA